MSSSGEHRAALCGVRTWAGVGVAASETGRPASGAATRARARRGGEQLTERWRWRDRRAAQRRSGHAVRVRGLARRGAQQHHGARCGRLGPTRARVHVGASARCRCRGPGMSGKGGRRAREGRQGAVRGRQARRGRKGGRRERREGENKRKKEKWKKRKEKKRKENGKIEKGKEKGGREEERRRAGFAPGTQRSVVHARRRACVGATRG